MVTIVFFWVSLIGVIIMLTVRATEEAKRIRFIPQKFTVVSDRFVKIFWNMSLTLFGDVWDFVRVQITRIPGLFAQGFMLLWGRFVGNVRYFDRLLRSRELPKKKKKSSSFFLNSIQEHKEAVAKNPDTIHE